jgi:hypothetical protein
LYWAMKVRHFSKVFAGNSVLQQYGTFTLWSSGNPTVCYQATKQCAMIQLIMCMVYPYQTLEHEISAKHDISSPTLSINVKWHCIIYIYIYIYI